MTNTTHTPGINLDKLRALIADDGYATSFQSMGQYRTALLTGLDEALRSERAEDGVVEANRKLLLDRSRVGLKKYGVPLANSTLSLNQVAQHALEEALDLANYLQTIILNDLAARQAAPEAPTDRQNMTQADMMALCAANPELASGLPTAATTASASSPDGYLNDDCDAPMVNGACTECRFGPCRRAPAPSRDAAPLGEAEIAQWVAVWMEQNSPFYHKPLQRWLEKIVSDYESSRAPLPAQGDEKPVAVRDALRRLGVDTDYHGRIVFTVAQFNQFASMVAAPAQAGDAQDAAFRVPKGFLLVGPGEIRGEFDKFSRKVNAAAERLGTLIDNECGATMSASQGETPDAAIAANAAEQKGPQ